MVSRMDEIILEEVRAIRRENAEYKALMEIRVSSLEQSRAEQKGAATATVAIASVISGIITLLISWFKP